MRRSFASVLGMVLVLSGCGGSGSAEACANDFWNGTVGTCVPENWIVIDDTVMAERGIEASDQVVVAFEAEQAEAGQFPRVAITQETLPQASTPQEFSEASVRAVVGVTGYEQLDMKEVEVAGETVMLHVFSAQPDEGKPKQRFYQLSTVSGSVGYSVTGMAPLSIDRDLEKEILTIVQSLTFSDPSAEAAAEEE